jgi:hypothetical protein
MHCAHTATRHARGNPPHKEQRATTRHNETSPRNPPRQRDDERNRDITTRIAKGDQRSKDRGRRGEERRRRITYKRVQRVGARKLMLMRLSNLTLQPKPRPAVANPHRELQFHDPRYPIIVSPRQNHALREKPGCSVIGTSTLLLLPGAVQLWQCGHSMGRFHGSGHLIVSRWRDGLIDQMGNVMKGKGRVITLVGFSSSATPALSICLRCGECWGMSASRSLVLRYCS